MKRNKERMKEEEQASNLDKNKKTIRLKVKA